MVWVTLTVPNTKTLTLKFQHSYFSWQTLISCSCFFEVWLFCSCPQARWQKQHALFRTSRSSPCSFTSTPCIIFEALFVCRDRSGDWLWNKQVRKSPRDVLSFGAELQKLWDFAQHWLPSEVIPENVMGPDFTCCGLLSLRFPTARVSELKSGQCRHIWSHAGHVWSLLTAALLTLSVELPHRTAT